ncbi:hypothetical protein D3C71_78540 [compost metagenome]
MSNVFKFPAKKPKPEEPTPSGMSKPINRYEKMEALEGSAGNVDLGLYVWLLKECGAHLAKDFPNPNGWTADDYVREALSYDINSPVPGTVKFQLFGWFDTTKPTTDKPGEYSKLFCRIEQSRIENKVEARHTLAENAMKTLLQLTTTCIESFKPYLPLVQFMFPIYAIGGLCSTGAAVTHFLRPASDKDKYTVVLQDHKTNTEYRMEVWYSALKGDSP